MPAKTSKQKHKVSMTQSERVRSDSFRVAKRVGRILMTEFKGGMHPDALTFAVVGTLTAYVRCITATEPQSLALLAKMSAGAVQETMRLYRNDRLMLVARRRERASKK